MNKLAISTAYLGKVRNRYMDYQAERTLEEKVKTASQVEGVDGLELCYPADFGRPDELRRVLEDCQLGVAAVNYRSRRTGKWWRGSFTSEKASERQEVIDDLKRAMDFASELGCNRVTTCPLNEGTDIPFEADYGRMYDHASETLSAACAHNRGVQVCIEYKKSDPMGHCLLRGAGDTAAFCQMVGSQNLGVTLDIGHSLYADERPAQSVALLTRAERLFYVHLNDNDGQGDWDVLPGAYHFWEFVEFFYALRKAGYEDDWYAFDVLPKEIDIVRHFTAVVKLTRKLEEITDRIDVGRMGQLQLDRDPSQTASYLYSLL